MIYARILARGRPDVDCCLAFKNTAKAGALDAQLLRCPLLLFRVSV